jgi:hypothetical protein
MTLLYFGLNRNFNSFLKDGLQISFRPCSPGERTHNYRLVVAYFASTLLVNTRTAEASTQEIPGGWGCTEVCGTLVRLLVIYLATLSDSNYKASNGQITVNKELERMRK